jgi:AraC-like DNA-binding protein
MHTAHVATVKRILSAAERQGFGPTEVLTRAKVADVASIFLLADLTEVRREHWVAIEPVIKVWDYAAKALTRERLLDDLLQALPVEELGPLGFSMLTQSSLDASIDQVMRYFAVITSHGEWARRESAQHVSLVWKRVAHSPGKCLANEAIFAHLVVMLQQLAGTEILPDRISFQHPQQPSSAALSMLLPVPVKYSARDNEIVFRREPLTAVPRLANPAMAKYFERRLTEQLVLVRGNPSVVDALRLELRREATLAQESLDAASDRLKVSRRTLQRRLVGARTSFSAELLRARQERAFELVTKTARPLAEVATELGFADASTFARAFRRWFEAAPSELRRSHRG